MLAICARGMACCARSPRRVACPGHGACGWLACVAPVMASPGGSLWDRWAKALESAREVTGIRVRRRCSSRRASFAPLCGIACPMPRDGLFGRRSPLLRVAWHRALGRGSRSEGGGLPGRRTCCGRRCRGFAWRVRDKKGMPARHPPFMSRAREPLRGTIAARASLYYVLHFRRVARLRLR